MVLSLAFILAFIGAAVALLIGILIFSEVEDALAGTFGVTPAPPPMLNSTLSNEIIFSTGLGDANFEIGHDNENDYPTGSVATNNGQYYTWVEFDGGTERRIYFSFTSSSTPETAGTPVEVDLFGISNHTRTLYLFVDEPTVDIIATIDPRESIYHYRSTDSGGTWGSPTLVADGLNVNGEEGNLFPMWVDVEGNTISMVYRVTSINAPFTNPVYMETSTNGGSSYSPRINILNDTNYVWEHPRLLIDGSDIHHAFINTDPHPDEVVYYSSSDTGATVDQAFESGIVLSTTAGDKDVQTEIAVDGSDVSIFYIGYNTVDYSFAQVRSNNGGSTWTSHEEIFDDTTCTWNQSRTGEKVIDIDGRTIQVICAGLLEVDGFTGRSTDMGANWSSLTSFVNGDPLDEVGDDMTVAVQGSDVYVAWQKFDDAGVAPTGNRHTAFAFSDDGGLTFTPEQLLTTPTSNDDTHITVMPNGENVWVGTDRVPAGEVTFFTSGLVGGGSPSSNVPPEFAQASNIAFTVIAILPVALFFVLFAIFGSLGGGRQ